MTRDLRPDSWLVPGAITPKDLCPKCEKVAFYTLAMEHGPSVGAVIALMRASGWEEFTEHAGFYRPCTECAPPAVAADVEAPVKVEEPA